uniref:Uncharacterized protein n=1 Tax=Oryza brachyantha TaxID=4533 RepID=J3KVB6_ORYBR
MVAQINENLAIQNAALFEARIFSDPDEMQAILPEKEIVINYVVLLLDMPLAART